MKKRLFLKIFIFTALFCFYLNLQSNDDLKNEKMYFCMAADSDFTDWLLNLIGSIHKVNFKETQEIAIYDLGLTKKDRDLLNSIKKVKVYDLEMTHPDLLKHFVIRLNGKKARGWYAWKLVAAKQALERFPYVLYLDAGCTVVKPLNGVFDYIRKNKYFFVERSTDFKNDEGHKRKRYHYNIKNHCNKYVFDNILSRLPNRGKIINSPVIVAGILGLSKEIMNSYVMPLYQYTKNMKYFEDDGTCAQGFGSSFHDQILLSIQAYLNNFKPIPAHKKFMDGKDKGFCASKFAVNDPTIYWHCKGKLQYKEFIRFK